MSSGFGRPEPENGKDLAERLVGLRDDSFTVPDMIGTVEGWRAWNVLREPPAFGTTPRLESATYSYWWTPRVKARAECPKHPDHVPGQDCTCGFYAAKTLPHLRKMGYQAYDEEAKRICVVGRLAMWGKVIEGDQGWRSEYAYPNTMKGTQNPGTLLGAFGQTPSDPAATRYNGVVVTATNHRTGDRDGDR
jgi:hypothetical protein